MGECPSLKKRESGKGVSVKTLGVGLRSKEQARDPVVS